VFADSGEEMVMAMVEDDDELPEPGHDVGPVALVAIVFLVLVGALSVLAMVSVG
jgi:hypothetical protein